MDNRQKILNLIGLATKAGKTASGEFMTEKSVKTGKASLVIVSEEASENTKKMFTNMCTYYQIPIYFFASKNELGRAMGKEMRASLVIVDNGFAKAVMKLMNTMVGSECKKEPSPLTACAVECAQNGGKHESI
ncbi:ribosomal L7Ae/L30e/S12e/Gadd45 family protein [Clostridium sp. HBUAS56010]|uniref:ribosomal L7Ae/L30e/S12e/Gadd45 family protein n=1 Tax=Clostridium sp. HBUAS56010 TaxID=2571127 RepID=UPI00117769EB